MPAISDPYKVGRSTTPSLAEYLSAVEDGRKQFRTILLFLMKLRDVRSHMKVMQLIRPRILV